jgi:DNA-binding NarL/FixJ family response regulator
VRGYANRLAAPRVLDVLLATVESGEIWAGRQVTDYLLAAAMAEESVSAESDQGILERLTAREAEMAGQVAAGLSNKAIAIENGISERTVKAHLNSIFRKTGIRNRVQLALAVTRGGDKPRQRSSA